MGRFIDNKATELNNNNIDTFVTERANLPKCILFTDKAGNPLIFKALSNAFDVTSFYKIRKKLNSVLSDLLIQE